MMGALCRNIVVANAVGLMFMLGVFLASFVDSPHNCACFGGTSRLGVLHMQCSALRKCRRPTHEQSGEVTEPMSCTQ